VTETRAVPASLLSSFAADLDNFPGESSGWDGAHFLAASNRLRDIAQRCREGDPGPDLPAHRVASGRVNASPENADAVSIAAIESYVRNGR